MVNERDLRVAIVCPDDLSVVLFCKGIVQALQTREVDRIVVISDVFMSNGSIRYDAIIRSWGVEHIPVKFYRFVDPFKDLRYTMCLYRIFRRKRINMVVNISTKPNVFGTLAARLAHVKNITSSVWGMGVAFVDSPDPEVKFLKIVLQSLYWMAFRLNHKVWFTNENDYSHFLKNGILPKGKGLLTKNYVSTDDYAPTAISKESLLRLRTSLGFKPSDKVVIMVGRMSWAKGVREFVDAASILKDGLPHVKFLLVGPTDDGSPDSIPASYLKDQPIKNGNFQWVGFRSDVKELYAISDLAVLPTYYREGGFPRGLTEPMAMGKPVIASESVHCRGTVDDGENGLLIPIKNAKALAAAINTLMTDDDLRHKFGQHSREKAVREFDEKAIVPKVIMEIIGVH